MFCFNCGIKLHTEDEKECQICGVKFALKCPACAFPNPAMARFCLNCGNGIVKVSERSSIQNFDTLVESRKNVAVIFADVSGFTALSERMDPEEVREIINDCFNYITKPVYELEGTIDKYIGDCIMILFGAKYSHGDDARRAVVCAMKMMSLVKEFSESTLASKGYSLGLSIGVNYGLVVTGSVGNYFDKDYTVMGDIVNTAQRLQSSAGEGTILVSESVYMETKDVVEFSSVREVQVKNKEKPVRCYSPVRLNTDYSYSREMALVGRENEIGILNSMYNDILNTGTRCISVIGEPGIGKTRIIKEFTSKLGNDVKKIWVDLSPTSQNRVYYVISSILTSVMNINPEDSTSIKQHRLMSFLDFILSSYSGEERKRNYNFIGLVLGLSRDNEFNDILDSMSFDNIKRELVKQLSIFFSNTCRKYRIAVIVDDMHWADTGSLGVLNELMASLAAVNAAFIFSSRSEVEGLTALGEWRYHSLKLEPLDEAGTKSFACRLLDCDDMDTALVDLILRFTKGNPLYIKEFISNIKRTDRYHIRDGVAYIDSSEAALLPNNIQNLILANLSEMNDNTRNFLQVASVIGKDFSLSLVGSLVGYPVDEDILRLPVQLNIISQKSAHTSSGVVEKVYTFNQDMEREVIYDSILNKSKKELHRRIAELIESRYFKEIESNYELLCTHFHAAGVEDKAAEYYYKTALKYKDDFSFSSSLEYYNKFLQLAGSHGDDAVKSKLVSALIDVGYINFVMADYDAALDSLIEASLQATLSYDIYTVKIMLADIYKEQGRFEEALGIIDEVEPRVRQDSNIYGKLLRMKCEILRIIGNPEALSFAKKSEKILLKAKEYQSLAETINQAGIVYFMKGDIDNALRNLNKSYKYAEKINDLEVMAKVAGNLGIIYYATGMVSKAFDSFNKSVSLSKKISDQQGYITGCNNLGVLYLDKGLFNRAEASFNESLEISMEIQSRLNECMTMTNLGDVMYERGIYDKALELYNRSLEIARDISVPEGEVVNCLGLARVYLKTGAYQKVPAVLDTAFQIFADSGEMEHVSDYYRFKALYQLQSGDFTGVLECCDKAIETSVEFRNDRRKLKALRLKANMLSGCGELHKAIPLLDEAITLAESLESDYEAAKGWFRRSEVNGRLGNNGEAQKDLARARECMQKIDVCRWTEVVGVSPDLLGI